MQGNPDTAMLARVAGGDRSGPGGHRFEATKTLSCFALRLADQVDRTEGNIPQGHVRIIPTLNFGDVVDFVDANHEEFPLMVIDSDPLAPAWRAYRCHGRAIVSQSR